ncbi:hypothetical protein ACT42A_18570 (plasmid) [Acinetobacter baumannii]
MKIPTIHPDGHEMKVASIRFMAIHDDLFGEQDPRVKFNDAAMKQIERKLMPIENKAINTMKKRKARNKLAFYFK